MFGIPIQFEDMRSEVSETDEGFISVTDLYDVTFVEDWKEITQNETFAIVNFLMHEDGMEIHFWKEQDDEFPIAYSISGTAILIPEGAEFKA